MSKLDEVRALFPPDGRVQCVENTYIPDRAGVTLRVTDAGKSYVEGQVLDVAEDPVLKRGQDFRCSLPTRVCDVIHVDGTRATWRLDQKLPRLRGHTVTYRRLVKDSLLGEKYRIDPVHNWRAGHIERARGGDGYDVMAKVEEAETWRAIPSWGQDGWDLGDWPYVVIYGRRTPEGRFQVATYCEGDVTIYEHATREQSYMAVDAIAFFYWKNHGYTWVEGIETADDMPPRLCGPYSSDRVRVTA